MKPSLLENPFAPEKHRSADDPKFVGKILGAEAEAAMRKTIPLRSPSEGEGEVGDELTLTPEEQAQTEEERKKRKQEQPWTYAEVVAWAEAIGKDDDWVKETFTFQPDGSLIVLKDLNLGTTPCDRLPHGLKEIRGNLALDGLTSAEHLTLPTSIGGDLFLDGLTSAEHLTLPTSIGGDLFLSGLTSAEHLTLPETLSGSLLLNSLTSAEHLILSASIGGSLYLNGLPDAEKEKLRKERPDLEIR